jgi:hypothetical protein
MNHLLNSNHLFKYGNYFLDLWKQLKPNDIFGNSNFIIWTEKLRKIKLIKH